MVVNGRVCKLINSRFTWMLVVDGVEIPFSGCANARYFADHYSSLGYEVVWEDKYKEV